MKKSERLGIALKNKGVYQEDVGNLLQIKQGSVSYRMINDAFNDRDIVFICSHFGINSDWVISGEGEMFGPGEASAPKKKEEVQELFPGLRETEEALRKRLEELNNKLLESMEKEREIRDKYEALLERMVGKG